MAQYMFRTFSSLEKRALNEFKNQVFQELKKEVLGLKIFGSKARGNFKKSSDIDVLILLEKSTLRNKKLIFDLATQILLKYGVDLSIKVFSKEGFQKGLKLEIPFYLEVNREAKTL